MSTVCFLRGMYTINEQTNSVAFSPQAKYTEQATTP
jgi:hypothetical protein